MGETIHEDGKLNIRRFCGMGGVPMIQITPYGDFAVYSEEEFKELIKGLAEAIK